VKRLKITRRTVDVLGVPRGTAPEVEIDLGDDEQIVGMSRGELSLPLADVPAVDYRFYFDIATPEVLG
jgi:hypothetical protein